MEELIVSSETTNIIEDKGMTTEYRYKVQQVNGKTPRLQLITTTKAHGFMLHMSVIGSPIYSVWSDGAAKAHEDVMKKLSWVELKNLRESYLQEMNHVVPYLLTH